MISKRKPRSRTSAVMGRRTVADKFPDVPADEPTRNFTLRLPQCVWLAITTDELRDAAVRIWRRKGGAG